MVSPIVDEIAAERSDITVCKVNVDEQAELANRFRVMSIPTLIVMKNGQITGQAHRRKIQGADSVHAVKEAHIWVSLIF